MLLSQMLRCYVCVMWWVLTYLFLEKMIEELNRNKSLILFLFSAYDTILTQSFVKQLYHLNCLIVSILHPIIICFCHGCQSSIPFNLPFLHHGGHTVFVMPPWRRNLALLFTDVFVRIEPDHHNVTLVQILRNLHQASVLAGEVIRLCLSSSTSTIMTWLPISKRRSGLLWEHPSSIRLSDTQPTSGNFSLRCVVTAISFVL